MKIIFATHNEGKLIEMKQILSDFEVFGAKEAGVFEDVVEDGLTFAENALRPACVSSRGCRRGMNNHGAIQLDCRS